MVANLFWLIAMLALLVALVWLSRRIEPHRSSKDGRSFTCRVREVYAQGTGPWSQANAVVRDRRVVLQRRGIFRPRMVDKPRAVVGRSEASGRFAIFLLDGPVPLALRVPSKSPAARTLAELVAVT